MENSENIDKFSTSVLIAQLGARRHYAVPRILEQSGLLKHFYTDICAVKGWPSIFRYVPSFLLPAGVKRLKGRIPQDIAVNKITTFNSFGYQYAARRRTAHSIEEQIKINLWAGNQFNDLIIRNGFNGAKLLYGFNTASEKLLQAANSQKIPGIVEQTIAPYSTELELLTTELESFPQWGERQNNKYARQFIAREKNEWSLAKNIFVGSEFVKKAIAAAGGPSDKCKVIPYGVDLSKFLTVRKHDSSRKNLHVLFIGEAGIRKGIPYLLAALKTLEKHPVSCRIVGGNRIPENEVSKLLPTNTELVGPVPRMIIHREFQWADILCLPSLCEGSATVTYEALAAGLPVITTPNSGSIVRNGQEGFIVPIRNSQVLADCIAELCFNRKLLKDMSHSARLRSSFGSLEAYGDRLVEAVKDCLTSADITE